MKYRPDIDGLRTVAILPVVLYHAGIPSISGGYVGVDVFFVISGFLITTIVREEVLQSRFSLIGFYERRARRILPALGVVVLATLATGWFVLLPQELDNLGQSTLFTALFLSNFYFYSVLDYFGPAAEFAPLLHTWSLAVEEQFYLFFPPLLALLVYRLGMKTAITVIVGLSLASLVAAIYVLQDKPNLVFYSIVFRAWELGIGAVLALVVFKAPKARLVREFLALLALLSIVVPVIWYDAATAFPGLAAVPPVVGAALLIYVGSGNGGSLVNTTLSQRPFVWIGLISYSLYLWHWPIMAYLRVVTNQAVLPVGLGISAILASFACAWLSFQFVEKPFRLRAPEGFSRQVIFSRSATLILMISAIGGWLHISHGVPGRLPPKVVEIAAVKMERDLRHNECFGKFLGENSCRIGMLNPAKQSIEFVFWGDSHAGALMPGVSIAARNTNKTGVFLGTNGCPPIRAIKWVNRPPRCQNFIRSVWGYLNDNPDIPMVILGARWPLSVEGTRYRGEAGAPVSLKWVGASTAAPAEKDNATLFEAGLRETVQALLASGRGVVLLGSIPEIGVDVPTALARASMLGMPGPKLVGLQDFEERAGAAEQILARVADSHEKIRYLELASVFCSEQGCAIQDEAGNPLYFDDDHISKTAAETLLPNLLSKIWWQEESKG